MADYISFADYAKAIGVKRQTVYKPLWTTKLAPYTVKDGKKLLLDTDLLAAAGLWPAAGGDNLGDSGDTLGDSLGDTGDSLGDSFDAQGDSFPGKGDTFAGEGDSLGDNSSSEGDSFDAQGDSLGDTGDNLGDSLSDSGDTQAAALKIMQTAMEALQGQNMALLDELAEVRASAKAAEEKHQADLDDLRKDMAAQLADKQRIIDTLTAALHAEQVNANQNAATAKALADAANHVKALTPPRRSIKQWWLDTIHRGGSDAV